ncbi:MAG: hypothetical protein LBP59_14945, partial [Planctomycetaceae bacterium]|nr:hypothetical protein [Planctomycetaceae bacterium]
AHCPIKEGKEIETLEKIYSTINQNPKEVKKMATSMLQSLTKQGYKKGISEGVEKIKNHILTCLSKRFNKRVPRDIQVSVNSYSDLLALDSLFERALDCESFDEFREYLAR